MNQREMEKLIWGWLYSEALNVNYNETFIDGLEEALGEEFGKSRKMTRAEIIRLERASDRISEMIRRKS